MSHTRTRRAVARGFTLIELLVATLLSGVVLSSIYFVFIANSKQYYTQEQVVQMQETMRFALEVMKNDLRNAGQLAIVNGTADAVKDAGYCGPLAANLRAVDLLNNNGPAAPAALGANNNALVPDQIRVLTDVSGGTLLAATVAGGTIKIRPAAQQISRAAMDVVSNAARLTQMYKVNYFVRVLDQSGQFDLVPMTGVAQDGAGWLLTLERAPCVAGIDEVRVNAVAVIRYRIQPDDSAVGQNKTDLMRETLSATDMATVLRGLSVAEFAINLQVWGTYDTRAGAGDPPNIPADISPGNDVGNTAGNDEAATFNTQPHRIRALSILLATRSAREDADLRTAPDLAKPPAQRIAADRTWFDVSPQNAGDAPNYARVTTLTARVETPNLRTEGNP